MFNSAEPLISHQLVLCNSRRREALVRLGSLRTVKVGGERRESFCVPKRKGDNPKATGRQKDVDDARVTNNETLVRRGKKWFRCQRPGQAAVQEITEDADGATLMIHAVRARMLGGGRYVHMVH